MNLRTAVMPVARDFPEWDGFLQRHPHGTHWHFGWWMRHHRRRFASPYIVVVRDGERVVGGAGCFRFGPPVLGGNVTVVTNAPLVENDDPQALGALLDEMEQQARRSGSLVLQLEAFPESLGPAIQAHFAGRCVKTEPVWKLYHPGIWREIRIPLAGRTPESMLKDMSRLVRRQIQKAEEAGTVVLEGCDEALIRQAHGVWSESAGRKGYIIRPFEDFRSLILESHRRGMACLFVAQVGGEPAAFLFSLLYGSGAVALYTGFTDKHADVPCNRLLHWRTMMACRDKGIPYLSLAAPGRGGVLQFKEHFKPDLIDNTRFITVVLHPLLARLARPFIGDIKWMEPLKRLAGGKAHSENS